MVEKANPGELHASQVPYLLDYFSSPFKPFYGFFFSHKNKLEGSTEDSIGVKVLILPGANSGFNSGTAYHSLSTEAGVKLECCCSAAR